MTNNTLKKIGNANHGHLMVPSILLIVLLIAAAIRGPQLYTNEGMAGAIMVAVPLILATLALTPVALVGRGGVDLAVGPLLGFINVSLVSWLVGHQVHNPVLVVLYVILAGVLYQLIQGAIIVYVRVAPIIVTLSSFVILTGVNLKILDRPSGFSPPWMSKWGAGTEIFSPVLGILAVGLVLWFLLSRTAFFTNIKLTGADERMAYTSGVNIDGVRLGAHVVAGIYAGLAALAYTALIGSGDPTQGSTYTLSAITALVLGGTSLAGGRGGGLGSLLGAINMYLITYVLATFSFGMVSGFVTQMSFGVILVISLQISVLAAAKKSKSA